VSREPDHIEVRRIILSVLEECSQCHYPHSLDDFQVVGRRDGLWVLRVHCTACHAEVYVAAVVGEAGFDIAETDGIDWLDANDLAVEAEIEETIEDEPEPVTVDDVLDMHEFLETFDGDFHALFARRRR